MPTSTTKSRHKSGDSLMEVHTRSSLLHLCLLTLTLSSAVSFSWALKSHSLHDTHNNVHALFLPCFGQDLLGPKDRKRSDSGEHSLSSLLGDGVSVEGDESLVQYLRMITEASLIEPCPHMHARTT
jgi:hypothetical protein